MTELQELKEKCLKRDGSQKKGATAVDLARLKELRDGEPLSEADLAEVQKRQEERATKDKADFEARQVAKATEVPTESPEQPQGATPSLDAPPEHPRIEALKKALLPFTMIEANVSRPNEYVLFRRGVAITAGDIRNARKAMKL